MPRRTRRRRRKPLGTFSSNGRSQPIGRLVLDIYPSIYRYVTVFWYYFLPIEKFYKINTTSTGRKSPAH